MKPTSIVKTQRRSCAALALLTLVPTAHTAYAGNNTYRLHFTGKPGSQLTSLTERALQRRARQGIPIDSTDYEVSPTYLAALSAAGLKCYARSRWLNTAVVGLPDGAAIDTAYWENFPFIKRVDQVGGPAVEALPPHRNREEAEETAEDSTEESEAEALALDYTWPICELSGEALFTAHHMGSGMLIAVLDAGFKNANRYTWLNRRVVGYYDLIAPDTPDLIFSAADHGTQVLSVMACDTTHGMWGAAPEADYYLIRTENYDEEEPIEEDYWVMGAEMADSLGADLINSSVGYSFFDCTVYNHTPDQLATDEVFISRGARVAATKGMLICESAGNERTKAWGNLLFPADVREVLTVAATGVEGNSTAFTSPGFINPWVKPNVAGRGYRSFVIDALTGGVSYANGTSFATPLICGLAASLWSAVPSLTAQQIHNIICTSAEQYNAPDSIIGYGRPNFANALTAARILALVGGVQAVTTVTPDAPRSHSTGIFDLMGRRLAAPPTRGCYIEDGKLKRR